MCKVLNPVSILKPPVEFIAAVTVFQAAALNLLKSSPCYAL